MTDFIYDIETYKNCFTCAFEHAEYPFKWMFEISDFKDQSVELMAFLNDLRASNARMVGFMNLGFDYPVIHMFMKMNGHASAKVLYDKAMSLIEAEDGDRFSNTVWASDRFIEQLDLYKIHHFDNKARATSLKKLEFNMGSQSIQDLPFPVGSTLSQDQIEVLKKYNMHDVSETKKFYHHTLSMIRFREELTRKYNRDFMNHNDTKIGKDYFIMRLEEAGVACYERGSDGRQPRQTKRPQIVLRDAILPSIKFEQPEFTRVLEWLRNQVITETKGVFKDLTAKVDGFEFIFGTGGIHGSVNNRIIEADDTCVIESIDVASMYPNIAIVNNFHPEHLGEDFCKIYKSLYEERKKYPKGSAQNAMLKLALNGCYGDSNNPYSPFYDPLMTMRITLTGQLIICMLAERLMAVPTVKIVMVNTDGMEYIIHPDYVEQARTACRDWESFTGLQLEHTRYKRMFIRDCNNYLAEYVE